MPELSTLNVLALLLLLLTAVTIVWTQIEVRKWKRTSVQQQREVSRGRIITYHILWKLRDQNNKPT